MVNCVVQCSRAFVLCVLLLFASHSESELDTVSATSAAFSALSVGSSSSSTNISKKPKSKKKDALDEEWLPETSSRVAKKKKRSKAKFSSPKKKKKVSKAKPTVTSTPPSKASIPELEAASGAQPFEHSMTETEGGLPDVLLSGFSDEQNLLLSEAKNSYMPQASRASYKKQHKRLWTWMKQQKPPFKEVMFCF